MIVTEGLAVTVAPAPVGRPVTVRVTVPPPVREVLLAEIPISGVTLLIVRDTATLWVAPSGVVTRMVSS